MLTRTLIVAGAIGLVFNATLAMADPEPSGSKDQGAHAPQADAKALPPVFSALSFDKALAETKGTNKLLVAKFTAAWCGPCKMMDKTTWRDDKVVQWVKDNGLAVQVDVDKQQKIAREYGVQAMPTMILFKNGEPVDRTVGYRDASGLLRWMENAKAGKTELDAMEDKAKAQGDDLSIRERMDMARSFVQGGKFDKATKEYLWLWDNMLKKEPAMYGVRLSFMAGDIEDLCAQDNTAHDAFTKVRDSTEARLKGEDKSWDDLADWITLNQILRQPAKTLEWFDRIKGDPDSAQTLERFAFRLLPLLEEQERWADVGRLVRDPVKAIQRDHAMATMRMPMGNADAELRKRVQDMAMENFRSQAANMYMGLLAADRKVDAERYADEAAKLDDTSATRVELVRRAVEQGYASDQQLRLLDEAEKKGADVTELRAQVKKELAKKAG